MRTALFHNFTDKEFTGYWDGKAKTFKPGEKKLMQEWMAAHYAKHLTNQILMEKGDIFETYTSPKFPDQVPAFKELFDKACIVEKEDMSEEDAEIKTMNEVTTELPEKELPPDEENFN